MNMTNNPNTDQELPDSRGLNRRAVLMTAAVAAGAAAGVSAAVAQTVPATNFGAPLVELHLPANLLTLEQKAAMIKGMTDVVVNAMKLPPDPARFSFVQIIDASEGGFGVNGRIFTPHAK